MACVANGIGLVRVELSVRQGTAWGEVLQSVWPECKQQSVAREARTHVYR